LKRGDIALVVAPGDYGKVRPAVVIQADWLSEAASVIVCLITSDLGEGPSIRLALEPGAETGLHKPSEIMVEKVLTFDRTRCRAVVGRMPAEAMEELDRRLMMVLGLAA
jgi:mRNA interferase MazF